jgi:hypothetical protein
MKKLILLIWIFSLLPGILLAQNERAEKKAARKAAKAQDMEDKYNKAVTAIADTDFVIFPGTVRWNYRENLPIGCDIAYFLSVEKDYLFLQVTADKYCRQYAIEDYQQSTDQDGNIKILLVTDSYNNHDNPIEINLQKGNIIADIYCKRENWRLFGELLPTSESGYFKKPIYYLDEQYLSKKDR